jgi:hypothetical protein
MPIKRAALMRATALRRIFGRIGDLLILRADKEFLL